MSVLNQEAGMLQDSSIPSNTDLWSGPDAHTWLTPPQRDVLDCGLLTSGFNCVLQMPTGSGKTWLAEHAIAQTLSAGLRAIYLTPLRALATELAHRWGERFGNTAVGVFTGDYGIPGRPYPVPFEKARLLVMTPERLDACTRFWREHWAWLPEVDLVIVDELHLLGDVGRGARLEGAISRLRRLNPFARIIGLSATLGNRQELAAWLDGIEYVSDWRPIPLHWKIVRFKRADQKPQLLTDLVTSTLKAGGRSLVFVQSRRRSEQLARELCNAGLRAAHHHAGLDQTARRAVEGRLRAGDVDVVVATGTLEMGLNLPVRQVVLYDVQQFDGSDYVPLRTNTVWQRVGRAGRPGFDTLGEAVLIAPTWDREVQHYERGRFEPVRSGLIDERAVAEQVLIEVTSGLARTTSHLEAVLRLSLAAKQRILPDVRRVLDTMVAAGMVIMQGEDPKHPSQRLLPTKIGRAAVRSMLAPSTMLHFRRVLGTNDDLTFFDLLVVAATSDDCEPVIRVDFEELDDLTERLRRESSTLLRRTRPELQELLGVGGRRLLFACKTALVARDWTRTGNAAAVAEIHGCYAFEVDRLHESLSRLIPAMEAVVEPPSTQLQALMELDEAYVPLVERVRALTRMMTAGMDEAAATLTLIPGVGPALASRLRAAGLAHLEDVAIADPAEVANVPGISPARAKRLVEAASGLVRSRSALRYEERGGMAILKPSGWPADLDPYRLRRALDLTVSDRGEELYEVRGGSEPRQVRMVAGAPRCACPDAERGHRCKHSLAVLLARGDSEIESWSRRMEEVVDQNLLNLFDLWFDRSGNVTRRIPR
ncbi:MAG TPA: DEAD/DEAH box helicase [Herpetosiphonaceae bacterium]